MTLLCRAQQRASIADSTVDSIVLQPHPLSPSQVRVLKYPQEAEVLGQVVGVAMRFGDWQYADSQPVPRVRAALI